jgi:integrase
LAQVVSKRAWRGTASCRGLRTALAAGVRGDLSEAERRQKFSGHSLRAGLATAAQADERHVQKQLGHASAEMTRRYQRQRDRFRVNLTKAAGL